MPNIWKNIGEALSGAGGGLIKGLGETVDRFVTTKEEKEQLKQAMQKLVQDHEMGLKQLLLDEFKAEIEDRDSARRREVELAKTDKTDWLMYLSGVVALACFLFMVLAVIFDRKLELGIGDLPIFHQLMGIIEGVSLTIFAYYFGTSNSSQKKTRLMNDMTNKSN